MPKSDATSEAGMGNDRLLIGIIAAVGVLLVLLSMVFGSLPTTICLAIMTLCTIQGFWRGGAEILVLLLGTILATLLAPAIGKSLEGTISGMTGTGGIVGRIVSIGLVFVLVVLVVSMIGSVVARRWMAERPRRARNNRRLGGLLGLVEGVLLGMAALWIPISLEPIAQAQLAAATEAGQPPDSGAQTIVQLAASTKTSVLGGIANATNPIGNSRILSLAQDFSMISRDEEAMRHLLESPVMQRIRNLTSTQDAIRILESDPNLETAIKDGGMTAAMLLRIMQSPKVLDVLDRTTVVGDIGPLSSEIEQAITEAKTKVGSKPKENAVPSVPSEQRKRPSGGG
jgi:uncharacterized membrane protein required for colicin V production